MSFAWKDEHMETFLEIYRNHECLWNNKSENYHKTNIREKAYKTLHSELNLPQLSVNDIRVKIKTIRTHYCSLTISVADILKISETNWTIERYKYSSFHRSHSLRMNHLRCTSEVQKCKFALSSLQRFISPHMVSPTFLDTCCLEKKEESSHKYQNRGH